MVGQHGGVRRVGGRVTRAARPRRWAAWLTVLLLLLTACSSGNLPVYPTATSAAGDATAPPVAASTPPPAQQPAPAATAGATAPASAAAPAATATVARTPGDPVIAAAGDIACDPGDIDYHGGAGDADGCHQAATAALLAQINPTAILALGDLQYDDATLAKFKQAYEQTWGKYKDITHPTAGNHEYYQQGANGYFAYWGAAAGDPAKGYYSFDIGTWHLISLNAQCTQKQGQGPACDANSPQVQWLKADLAAHPNSCTLAFWHEPRFSSGDYGNDETTAPFWDALYAAGADIVLNGHEHEYERFALQDPTGKPSAKGIREFIVGTGGKSQRTFHVIDPTSEVRNTGTYGVLKLVLHPDGYDWQFVPEAGKTFTDSGTTACHHGQQGGATAAGGATPQPTPAGPAATKLVPAAGTTGVSPQIDVRATFADAMDPASLTTATVSLVKRGGSTPVPAVVSYNPVTQAVTLRPRAPLEPNTAYTATIKGGAGGAKGHGGIPLATDQTWSFTTGPASTSAYQNTVMADEPASYWRLGEAQGTTAADSGSGGNTGRLLGGIVLGAPGALANDPDTAMTFDGTSGYVNVPDDSSLDMTGDLTVEAWAKPGKLGATQTVLHKGDGTEINEWQYRLSLSQDNHWRATVYARNTSYTLTDPATVAAGQWYHLVLTRGGTTLTLYVDGVSVATGTVKGDLTTGEGPLAIGRVGSFATPSWAAYYFNGSVDEVAVYDHALSAGRIRAHYVAAGRPAPAGAAGVVTATPVGTRVAACGLAPAAGGAIATADPAKPAGPRAAATEPPATCPPSGG
ncbi:MAG TPA: LamG-like jellyroll fold domain-containing protein [Thermomicrobiales bacterium]|nr:LamG-like jellyroll fold domain-containing protein [Thermomicrobiales bacterium]